jgi:hypothetical protein
VAPLASETTSRRHTSGQGVSSRAGRSSLHPCTGLQVLARPRAVRGGSSMVRCSGCMDTPLDLAVKDTIVAQLGQREPDPRYIHPPSEE